MAQTIPEMALFLDSDLSSIQPLGYQGHVAKHCRLCCATAVCEDIWKKFAFEDTVMFPTPPVSPRQSPEPASDAEEERCCLEQVLSSLFVAYGDDDEDDKDDKQQLEEFEAYQNLRSNLIQDCMWGATSSQVSGTHTPVSSPTSFSDSELSYTESVDPSVVIPLVCRTTSNDYLRYSCSSQDESDEEIDVVTVEKNRYPEKRTSHSAPETPVASPVKKKPRLMPHVSSHSGSSKYHRLSSYRHRRRISRIEIERRASHNVLERKRRNDLKSSFNTLREHVPDLESNEKAPKVLILQKAACYIREIKQLDARLMEEKFEEQRKQELLLHKLQKLKELHINAS